MERSIITKISEGNSKNGYWLNLPIQIRKFWCIAFGLFESKIRKTEGMFSLILGSTIEKYQNFLSLEIKQVKSRYSMHKIRSIDHLLYTRGNPKSETFALIGTIKQLFLFEQPLCLQTFFRDSRMEASIDRSIYQHSTFRLEIPIGVLRK